MHITLDKHMNGSYSTPYENWTYDFYSECVLNMSCDLNGINYQFSGMICWRLSGRA